MLPSLGLTPGIESPRSEEDQKIEKLEHSTSSANMTIANPQPRDIEADNELDPNESQMI